MKICTFKKHYSKQVSDLIRNTIREINSKDYSKQVIEKMCVRYSKENIIRRASNRKMILMLEKEVVIGTASLKGNLILSVFVDAKKQGKGAGTKMMCYLEETASKGGFKKVLLPSSITSVNFYKKLGYKIIYKERSDLDEEIMMEKILSNNSSIATSDSIS